MLVTALVTPFREGGARIETQRLQELLAFQLEQGVDQVLLGGTTGEGALLTEDERTTLLEASLEVARPEQILWGLGFGLVDAVVARGRMALQRGVRSQLLVDMPYAGLSSRSLGRGWHGAVAEALPEARLLPYAVPSRTGCELLPDDLARLAETHPNVVGVKDATGRLARMGRVRELLGPDFLLLCGDDHQLRAAMLDPDIRAQGGCSVVANLVPCTMRALVDAAAGGDAAGARRHHDELAPLFGLACVSVEEQVTLGGQSHAVPNRVRNPVPLKTAMVSLGLLAEGCREPLGEAGPATRGVVDSLLGRVERGAPDLLAPLMQRFALASPRRGADAGELVQGHS